MVPMGSIRPVNLCWLGIIQNKIKSSVNSNEASHKLQLEDAAAEVCFRARESFAAGAELKTKNVTIQ